MQLITRSLSLLAIAFLLVFTSSCSKDDDNATPGTPSNPNTFALSFTANGTNYNCVELTTTARNQTNPLTGGTLMVVSAVTTTGQNVTFTFNPATASNSIGGFFSINQLGFGTGANVSLCSTGTIAVTANNTTTKKISGTFNGSGTNLTITNGIFTNVGY
jgi:hypothetical protein